MQMTKAQILIEEALKLPARERSTVVAEILASLDGDADADAEKAWDEEIERRAQRAIAGDSQGKDWASVRAEIEAHRRR
jgi:hypothetical protein